MRVALVAHGWTPLERTGVENHCAALAAALARAGHTVEAFAPRVEPDLPELSQRREPRDGYAITWLTLNQPARSAAEHLERPFAARAFGQFLDRERPQVVHFHHLLKLGVALIDEARSRGLPCVYTAHDYHPVCHRATLLRPDLERCTTLGDPRACARCDLAVSFLNRQSGLGDWHAGALPSQLGESERASLKRLLQGRSEPADLAGARPAEVERERVQLDARRAAAFAELDRILAPTRFLAERLAEGGLPRERIEVMPCGIEASRLAELAPPRAKAPLRFGFVGGIEKHKGPHVLLEAWRLAALEGELALWGDSSDRRYANEVRAGADALGVRWGGAYEAAQLPDVLGGIDVLVVPSLWFENAPFVIREAFAAKRPVIASRVGAMEESVRDGVDGLLVPPGDAKALAEALRRIAQEPGLLARLSAGIEPVVRIEDTALRLLALYERLLPAPRSPSRLPPSVEPFAARHSAVSALAARELLARVLGGLSELRRRLGVEAEAESSESELLARALASGSKVQELLRDARNESEWLRGLLAEAEARRAQDARRIEAGEAAARALAKAESHGREVLADLAAVKTELKRALADAEAMRAELEKRARSLDEAHQACARAARAHQEATQQAELLRQQQSEQERELAALGRHERWLREKTLELLANVAGDPAAPGEVPASQLADRFDRSAQALAGLRRELEWRRTEMRSAVDEGGALFRAMLRRARLGRRMARWPDPPEEQPR